MPSVRVKSGYTSLQDINAEHAPGPSSRARAPSITAAVASQTAQPLPHHRTVPQVDDTRPHSRARPNTLSARVDPASHGESLSRPSPRRPYSRVSQHIMNSTQTPHTGFRQGPITVQRMSRHLSEDRNSFFLTGTIAEHARKRNHSLTRHRAEDDDLISLQGPQTEVLVPAGDREPGRVGSALSLPRSEMSQFDWDGEHHPDDIVEHLDVIDPQISTVATLANAANAIVVPPMSFYSRKPVVVLPRMRRKKSASDGAEKGRARDYDENEDELDLHVEDVLRKRDRFRRVMRGVWSFVKTPLGFFTAIYGFLVVFWGTALVVFLARFINVHNDNTQDFWVEICQQIETGLFSLPSIGLGPFRIVDTYRICKIWHYKRLTERLRRKAGLPKLYDQHDLPDPYYDANYVPVLSEKEQIDLHYQQHKFMQSQTWYRPHGTETHRAFPIDIALWICVMNDLNTFFQCLLSGCMWGLNRFQRPAWTTAITLPGAFVAGIVAGFLVYWGGRKTKRVKEVTERLRMALAMERLPSGVDPERHTLTTTGEGASRVPTVQPVDDSDHALPRHGQRLQYKDFGVEKAESKTVSDPLRTPATPDIPIVDEMTVPTSEALGDIPGSRQ